MNTESPVRRAALSISDSLRLESSAPSRMGNLSLRDLFASPVLHLIENVHERFPESARHHLRKHIEVDGTLSFAERALVQVSAKRVRLSTEFPSAESVLPLPFHPRFGVETRLLRSLSEIRAHFSEPSFRESPEPGAPRHSLNRPIVAALIHRSGQVLLSARNEGGRIRCRHAELNLLHLLAAEHDFIPSDSLLVSGLKPCRMCAAFIASSARTFGDLRVLYLENDPGPLASATALEQGSAGRLEFLRESAGLSPREAQKIIRLPDYGSQVQLSAEDLPDTLTVTELFELFI